MAMTSGEAAKRAREAGSEMARSYTTITYTKVDLDFRTGGLILIAGAGGAEGREVLSVDDIEEADDVEVLLKERWAALLNRLTQRRS